MKKMKLYILPLVLALFANSAFATVIVNSDEWALSNAGMATAGASATTFAQNVATFLKGSAGAGNFLIYSDSAGLAGTTFANALTSVGHTVTFVQSTGVAPADLSVFNGIFLGGLKGSVTDAALTAYVNSGKGVYIAAGHGFTPGSEATNWNGFINNFGLTLSNDYNGTQGFPLATNGVGPIMSGVSQLHYDNGNNVSVLGGFAGASIVNFGPNQQGLIGAYSPTAVPEPASIALLGMAVLGAARRKKFLN